MDYIYAADADEVLDDFNHERFLRLKNALLPEIEIVQMKYVTDADFDTVLNAKKIPSETVQASAHLYLGRPDPRDSPPDSCNLRQRR